MFVPQICIKTVSRKWIFSATKTQLAKRSHSSHQSGRGLSHLHLVGKEPLQYRTVGQMIERTANKWPGNMAIVSKEENLRITYGDLLQKADELAAAFREMGLERGDRLGLWAPNCLMWNVIKIAACRAGVILAAINPMYQSLELKYCLNKVGVKALIAPETFGSQHYYDMVRELAPELVKSTPGNLNSAALPTLKSVVILSDKDIPGVYNNKSLASLSNATSAQKISSEQHLVDPDDGCNIQFTSGTTGRPKAALVSHMNIVNNTFYIGKRSQLDSDSKVCVQVPLFHAFGVVISSVTAFHYGSALVIPALKYNPKANLNAILSEKCTVVHGTPTMFVDLVAEVEKSSEDPPTTLKLALTGGASCSPHLVRKIHKKLNTKSVMVLFGMTELTACAFMGMPNESSELTHETVGKIQEHLEVKVVDPEGRTVPFGQPGEVCVRGYSVMLGYWGDVERTKESIVQGGWMKTGDQFVLLENGYGKIVGRIKDMIIRGGENLYPKEIEDYINTHPDIMESHVFGVAHERLGEEVCVALKIKDGASLTPEGVTAYCKGKMANFKVPKHIRIVDSFPKTLSGKIQKFRLTQMFQSGEL